MRVCGWAVGVFVGLVTLRLGNVVCAESVTAEIYNEAPPSSTLSAKDMYDLMLKQKDDTLSVYSNIIGWLVGGIGTLVAIFALVIVGLQVYHGRKTRKFDERIDRAENAVAMVEASEVKFKTLLEDLEVRHRELVEFMLSNKDEQDLRKKMESINEILDNLKIIRGITTIPIDRVDNPKRWVDEYLKQSLGEEDYLKYSRARQVENEFSHNALNFARNTNAGFLSMVVHDTNYLVDKVRRRG